MRAVVGSVVLALCILPGQICATTVEVWSASQFQKAIREPLKEANGKKVAFVYVHSLECPVCISLKPTFNTLREFYQDVHEVLVTDMIYEEHRDMMGELGVRNTPHMLVLTNENTHRGHKYQGPRDVSHRARLP